MTKQTNNKKDEALDELGAAVDALSTKATNTAQRTKAVLQAAGNPALIGGALLGVFGMGMLLYARRSRKPRRTQIIVYKGGKRTSPVVGLLAEAGKLALKKAFN